MFAISYDPVEVLERFASQHGVTYPLLSDTGSTFIRKLGIFNDSVAVDSRSFGIPYPGTYIIDENGLVTSKVFHESNYVRDVSTTALRDMLGIELASQGPSAEWSDDLLLARVTLDADTFVRQRRVGWRVTVGLPEGLHVYGNEAGDGFLPLQIAVNVPAGVIVDGPRYPQAQQRTLAFASVNVPVHEGTFEVTGGLTFADIREDVDVAVVIEYQACNERECFAPAMGRVSLPIRYEAFA